MDLRSLLEHLRQVDRSLSPMLVAHVGREVAAALHAAHSAGTFHRDICPSNLSLTSAGDVELTHAGTAKANDPSAAAHPHSIEGRVRYMPPEYAQHGVYDARGDLFSLGVVLFESLSGQRPYDGDSDAEIMARSARGMRPELAEMVPEAPPALVDLIERLILPDPERRCASAAELTQALEAASPSDAQARRLLGALVDHFAKEAEPQLGGSGLAVDGRAPQAAPDERSGQARSAKLMAGATMMRMHPVPPPRPSSPPVPPSFSAAQQPPSHAPHAARGRGAGRLPRGRYVLIGAAIGLLLLLGMIGSIAVGWMLLRSVGDHDAARTPAAAPVAKPSAPPTAAQPPAPAKPAPTHPQPPSGQNQGWVSTGAQGGGAAPTATEGVTGTPEQPTTPPSDVSNDQGTAAPRPQPPQTHQERHHAPRRRSHKRTRKSAKPKMGDDLMWPWKN